MLPLALAPVPPSDLPVPASDMSLVSLAAEEESCWLSLRVARCQLCTIRGIPAGSAEGTTGTLLAATNYSTYLNWVGKTGGGPDMPKPGREPTPQASTPATNAPTPATPVEEEEEEHKEEEDTWEEEEEEEHKGEEEEEEEEHKEEEGHKAAEATNAPTEVAVTCSWDGIVLALPVPSTGFTVAQTKGWVYARTGKTVTDLFSAADEARLWDEQPLADCNLSFGLLVCSEDELE